MYMVCIKLAQHHTAVFTFPPNPTNLYVMKSKECNTSPRNYLLTAIGAGPRKDLRSGRGQTA